MEDRNETTPASGETEAFDPSALAPEDFYLDGPYMVFTAAYHLKRGYCCNSDCRHCPYR
jgi:hypothetical protein